MEPDSAPPYTRPTYPVSRPNTWHSQAAVAPAAAVVDPPVSTLVLERLASYLTPLHSPAADARSTYSSIPAAGVAPPRELGWAYSACYEVTKRYSRSFYLSARLLPPGKRDGIMALYAFCRMTDNIVDDGAAEGESPIARVQARLALEAWARATSSPEPRATHPVVTAWADTRKRCKVPQSLADELVAGVRMDLTINRYATWDDLWMYCYRVASTVGLMSMYITGAQTMNAVPYAVQLGVALQLTNILRDIREDAQAGRIYIPAEEMERFGYSEEMLLAGVINSPYIELMKFQIARAQALYRSAWEGIAMLPRDSRLAVAAAATVYAGILDRIAGNGYDVFSRRVHVSGAAKLAGLARLWVRFRLDPTAKADGTVSAIGKSA